jgi:transketolase C-terminal domain/subunit
MSEATEVGRAAGLGSLNAVVTAALEEFVERRRREAFAAAVARMAADPEVVGESGAITALFSAADGDGVA